MKYLIPSIILAFLPICTGTGDWCYQSQFSCDNQCNAPANWDQASEACAGRSQSPINIITRNTEKDTCLTPFRIQNYQQSFSSTIKNNGHSVVVGVPHLATIRGGGLMTTYKAVQFHLHWGNNGGPGSEHTIDGHKYPMELHIVHMKQQYNDLGSALSDPTGVAVLGFFYKESNRANRKYDSIISALENVKEMDGETPLERISLEQLIPSQQNLKNYYRYSGSLTNPGCAEAVVWTVFEQPIPLSKEQLQAFSELQFLDGTPMVNTFRPVQPLNGRQVYRSEGAVVVASTALLVASMVMAMGVSLGL